MAKLSVSVDVPLSPEKAWEAASDLSRFSEWLSIHRVWRSTLPETLEKGTKIDSIVEVKGMANRVNWTIVSYKPPESMTLNGDGSTCGTDTSLVANVGDTIDFCYTVTNNSTTAMAFSTLDDSGANPPGTYSPW